MQEEKQPQKIKRVMPPIRRILLEVGFIIFLFYSNLLMGEYTRSGGGAAHGIKWALQDILTFKNFSIALITALVGHLIFDYLLKRGH